MNDKGSKTIIESLGWPSNFGSSDGTDSITLESSANLNGSSNSYGNGSGNGNGNGDDFDWDKIFE